MQCLGQLTLINTSVRNLNRLELDKSTLSPIKMFLKLCVLIFLFNIYFVKGQLLYGVTNGFNHLNQELEMKFGQKVLAEARWIEQELDHFDKKEIRTWKMRYFANVDFQKDNGPVYLFIGGEGPASPVWTEAGIMYELAKETQGGMYVSEHRYYGESWPLNGTDAESLKFLSARQSLADNAKLLLFIKSLPKSKKSKIVVIGGSYPGNLAAWMKLLYPKLVDAAIASSAPVLAKVDFYEYLEKVSDNYEKYGTNGCLDEIRRKFQRYNTLLGNPKGIEQLKREENICQNCDLSKKLNKQLFFLSKVGEFQSNSQYGTVEKINDHCKQLINKLMYTELEESKNENCTCYDFDQWIESHYQKENISALSWTYQTCTEFGYFQTAKSDAHPFTDNISVDFYFNMCMKFFGSEFDGQRVNAGVNAVNKLYGAKKPNVTNVVFSNGDLDPWSTLSVLKDLSDDTPAIVIPKTSHCKDLLSISNGDIEELKEARNNIKQLIKKWLGV